MSFDAQPVLTGAAYAVRPLVRGDFDALRVAASDPEIWALHPQKDRWKPEVFAPYFDSLMASGATVASVDLARNRVIGCSRYYTAPDMPGTISIGFTFLERAYWGGAANLAIKTLMFEHAFVDFDAVWLHIDPTNLRSQRATAKLGAVHVYDAQMDLGAGFADFMCYRVGRDEWRMANG